MERFTVTGRPRGERLYGTEGRWPELAPNAQPKTPPPHSAPGNGQSKAKRGIPRLRLRLVNLVDMGSVTEEGRDEADSGF